MFYIEDIALERVLMGLPDDMRKVLAFHAWRKMGFVCDDGSCFLTFSTFSGLKKIIISEPVQRPLEETLKVFNAYLKVNFMEPHLVDDSFEYEAA
jgi:hypothetical protein